VAVVTAPLAPLAQARVSVLVVEPQAFWMETTGARLIDGVTAAVTFRLAPAGTTKE